MKVVIVGGVAGGASAAARLRRNDEHASIIMFERGAYISFANCGLPYYIGDVIHEKSKLTLQTPESFKARFNVDVRVKSEVIAIDREQKKVQVRRLSDGSVYEEAYDRLILAPGAEPARPALPGLDNAKVFTIRNIPDTYAVKEFCENNKPQSAVVAGGGYIGIEMAENLHNLGIKTTVVEMSDHIIPPVDYEISAAVQNHIRSKGVELLINTGVNSLEEIDGKLVVSISGGKKIVTDFIILSVGVRPENALAAKAGLKTGLRGCISVDEYMCTSDENIYAVGDAVEVTDFVSGTKAFIPLASPANKQGRIAADNICGRAVKYEGTQGSAVLKVFDMTLAATGNSEAFLKRTGIPYKKSFTYSASNASYYPGGLPMSIKLLFTPDGSRILGAQAAGFNGVDKRIDVIATVMRLGGSVTDLTKLELCYAPPFSSAKDPVNMAGYTAENIIKGLVVPFYPEDVPNIDPNKDVLLDVRTVEEFEAGTLTGAVNIPLDSLRDHLSELPCEKTIWVFCQIGLRGYVASRILTQSGFSDVRNLSGGYRLVKEMEMDTSASFPYGHSCEMKMSSEEQETTQAKEILVDACGLSCPGPIMSVYKAMEAASQGDVLIVRATDPAFESDIEAWCKRTGNELLEKGFDGKSFSVKLRKGRTMPASMTSSGNEKSIIVFSNDLDKAIAAFIIANGSVAMGRQVNLFFTFWGLNILRKSEKVKTKKDIISAMFSMMMPRGSKKLSLSKLNMGGMGAKMIRMVMKNNNITSLEDLIKQAIKNGVKITACSMSMDLMGIKREELIDGVEIGGVASFLASAEVSDTNLFI